MQQLAIFQFDSFTSELLSGNPAAVMPLESWLSDELLLKLARENNLSETAFIIPDGDEFKIRWFTPTAEVGLCGHATLAAAEYVLGHRKPEKSAVTFLSESGPLRVEKDGGRLCMDFPRIDPEFIELKPEFHSALGAEPSRAFWGGPDLFLVLQSEQQLASVRPDFAALKQLSNRGVVVTAPAENVDFVSRAFFPALGIDEDPVTGSTHCALAPYWAEQLGTFELQARQLSERPGEIACRLEKTRVKLLGQAMLYMKGTAFLPQ